LAWTLIWLGIVFSERFIAQKIQSPRVNFINILLAYFFVQEFVQSQTLSTKKLLKNLLYKKCAHKMLMKLTPILNLFVPWILTIGSDVTLICLKREDICREFVPEIVTFSPRYVVLVLGCNQFLLVTKYGLKNDQNWPKR